MEVQTSLIQHLGLVAGLFDQLGIGEVIDRALPKNRHHKLPHSIAAKAMILNGLGFTGQRLYLFPNFFRTIPVEDYLRDGGVDVEKAEISGQLVVLSSNQTYTREGSFDTDRMISLLISETEKALGTWGQERSMTRGLSTSAPTSSGFAISTSAHQAS
jgi:hypothetical protein